MFITRKHISRRTLLRGAGTALALPLLDAMIPAFTAQAKTAANAPPRFFGGFVPHGAAPGYWIPEKTVGALPDELPFIWKPMEPFRKHLNILTGLHSRSSEPPPGETGADHWVAAAFLCAQKPRKTAGADVYAGQTIDQIIAAKYGQETLLPSVEISVEDPGSGSSNCGEGYSCVYTNTIAWASPTTPLPMELNPQVVFERMFGSGSTAEQRVHAPRAQPEHPRFGQRQDQGCAQRGQRAGPRSGWMPSPTTCAKSSVVCRSPPVRRRPHRRISRCRRAFRSRSTSTSRSCSTCWRSASRPTSPASAPCCSRAISPAVSIRKARRRQRDSTASRTTARIRT